MYFGYFTIPPPFFPIERTRKDPFYDVQTPCIMQFDPFFYEVFFFIFSSRLISFLSPLNRPDNSNSVDYIPLQLLTYILENLTFSLEELNGKRILVELDKNLGFLNVPEEKRFCDNYLHLSLHFTY